MDLVTTTADEEVSRGVKRTQSETVVADVIQQIDGSRGEGGGQILRNAISFANILRQRLVVNNIRAKRTQPGLKAQHAVGLKLATSVCGGNLVGAEVGSMEITFEPAELVADAAETERTLTGEIKTAGSICLLLQAALPCALFSHKTCQFILKGGTNATMAPQYDYWERVFWPTLRDRCGLSPDQVQARVIQRGFFPRGGGEVHVRVVPLVGKKLQPLHLVDRGDVKHVFIRAFHAGKLPHYIALKMAKAARSCLIAETGIVAQQIKMTVVTESQAVGSGLGIILVAETTTGCILAGSALCEPKKNAADAGREAATELISTLREGGCVDEWLQDQLILYMALADGTSEIISGSLTQHTQTAIWIAEEMSGAKFEVTRIDTGGSEQPASSEDYGQDGRISGRHRIRCQGIGFEVKK